MEPKFSIRYKFLAVVTLLISICVGTYLMLATFVFREDKRALVFDYNRNMVTRIANDIERSIRSTQDQMRLSAYFSKRTSAESALISDILKKNPDVVFVGISKDFKNLSHAIYTNEEFVKTYEISEKIFFEQESFNKNTPYSDIQSQGDYYWTLKSNELPQLLGVGKTVIEEDSSGIPRDQFALIAYIKLERFMSGASKDQAAEAYVFTGNNEHFALNENNKISEAALTLYELAKSSKVNTQVARIELKSGAILGASTKILGGKFVVVSSVSEDKAFHAVNQLVRRSILFGSILLTLAFILAVLFSRSLTKPIDVLVGGMKKVSEGDLATQIKVDSKDEIYVLAENFNRMIRDLKESRAELVMINQELESKVIERTKELEERNHAVKEAQEALLRSTRLAAVGEVAGLAAHEVLNPLTSIVARLTELKKRVEEERSKEAQFLIDLKNSWETDFATGGFKKLVETWNLPSNQNPDTLIWHEDIGNLSQIGQSIKTEYEKLITDTDFLIHESQRVGRIVNSFRSLNSVNAEIRNHNIHEICKKSVEIMTDYANKNKTELKCETRDKNLFALIGEDEVIQVLTNLIRNSIQSIVMAKRQKGEVKISILSQDGKAYIHVQDNGCGISMDNQKKLFEKRFSTKSRSEGTGIGLSISRRLIRAFKGDITLGRSEDGKGAEFIVMLPLAANTERRPA